MQDNPTFLYSGIRHFTFLHGYDLQTVRQVQLAFSLAVQRLQGCPELVHIHLLQHLGVALRVAQHGCHRIFLLVTHISDFHLVARTHRTDGFLQLGHLLYILTIDSNDHVALAQPGLGSCGVVLHFGHINAVYRTQIYIIALGFLIIDVPGHIITHHA